MTQSSLPVLRALLTEAGYQVHARTSGWSECFVHRDDERWEGRGQTEDEALHDAFRKMFPSHAARQLFARHASHDSHGGGSSRPGHGFHNGAPSSRREPPAEARDPDPDGGALGRVFIAEPASQPALPAAPPPIEAAAPPSTMRAPVAVVPVAVEEPALAAAIPALPDAEPAHEPIAAEAAPSSVSTPVVLTLVSMAEPNVSSASSASPAPAGLDVATLPRPDNQVDAHADAPPAPVPVPDKPPEEPVAILRPRVDEPAPKPARVRMAEALETVDKQLTAIEEQLPHLARMCGERQRLNMMVWICRARAVEEAHPGMREVEQAVARVARSLTDIGKMFWPGSVRALQLSARPGDVKREMHANWASEPANWREATHLAERLLEEHLAKSPDLGLDEDGWADSAARTPRPADPDALFAEVDAEIKATLIPAGEVPNGRAGELSGAEMDLLVTAARKLRWVRGAVRDDKAWGVAVGRLRRAVPSLGERGGRVRDALDHRTKPSASWAKVLGEIAAEPTTPPGESVADLQADLPSAITTTESLVAWLVRAFDVLSTPDLVPLVAPVKSIILAFGEETLKHSDRRVRRRLGDLVKRLQTANDVPVLKPEPAPVEDAVDEPIAAHALTALAAKVREKTQGRRVLFVSNREDPELGARLSDLLGIEITWCDGSLRRVQAQCERIKGGSYTLILSATGFQVHGVDSALARAAGSSDVPYVRVNRGRPVACVQAIAREFGLVTTITEQPGRAGRISSTG